jgi:hypothetical protein
LTTAAPATTTVVPDETEVEQYVPFIVTTAFSSVLGLLMIYYFKPSLATDGKGAYSLF